MVTRVVPRDDLMATTRAMARTLLQLSPRALRDTRNLMYRMESMDFSHVPEVQPICLIVRLEDISSTPGVPKNVRLFGSRWTGYH